MPPRSTPLDPLVLSRIAHEAGHMFDALVRPNVSGFDQHVSYMLIVGDVVRGGVLASANTFSPENTAVALVAILEGLVGLKVQFAGPSDRVDVIVTGRVSRDG